MRVAVAALVTAILLPTLSLAANPPRRDYDAYGGWLQYAGTKTGFFHVEKVRDRYWLVTPEGNLFLCKGLLPAPGREESRLEALGFNALAGAPSARYPYTLSLDIGMEAVAQGAAVTAAFPDVFSPIFAQAARAQADKLCRPHAADPYLIGYLSDDRLAWTPPGGGDLVDAYLAMPDDTPGRTRLLSLLSERYGGDIAAFNATWGLSAGSFADLGRRVPLKVGRSCDPRSTAADRSCLMGAIATRYFQVVREAIRSCDGNHLILGPVFCEWVPAEAVPALRETVDVVALQARLYPPPANLMGQLFRDCGKPVLLASFAGGTSSKDYARYVQRLAEVPFVLGYQWAGPALKPTAGTNLAEQAEISRELQSTVTKSNADYFKRSDFGRMKPGFWRIEGKYEVVRTLTPLVIDGRLEDWHQAGARVMELAISPYSRSDEPIQAHAYLMWDAGNVYVAGDVLDKGRVCPTLTQVVGQDWLELAAGPYSYEAALRPGTGGVHGARDGSVRLVSRGIPAEGAPGALCGFAYEAAIKIPIVIPEGFRFNCGITLHHYTADGREVLLSFPANYARYDPRSAGEVVVVGPKRRR